MGLTPEEKAMSPEKLRAQVEELRAKAAAWWREADELQGYLYNHRRLGWAQEWAAECQAAADAADAVKP
jgi:hypothetical protein